MIMMLIGFVIQLLSNALGLIIASWVLDDVTISADEDVEDLTASLPPNSSAAVLVFEHTWAIPLRDALVRGGGELVANLRIPSSVVDEILATAPQAD